MENIIIFNKEMGQIGLVGLSKPSLCKAHNKFKGPLSNPAHICLLRVHPLAY